MRALNEEYRSAQNIVSGDGTGSDNSSIWLVVWGENTIRGIYPKGSQAGLIHEDFGLQTIQVEGSGDSAIAGARMRAYQERYQWKNGISLKDWRYVVRIPNVDISQLVAQSNAADLTKLMVKAVHRIPNMASGRPAFYMNRTCIEFLDIQRRDDVQSGGQLKYEVVDGKNILTFRQIPIRMVDQLVETEATVS